MKYILLLNSILYKSYEYSKLDYFIFCVNLINRIISYLIFFIFCYDLYINYSNNKLMLLSYLIYDVFLLYDANKLIFLKIVGKNFDLMLKPQIKIKIRVILVIFFVLSILLSIGVVVTEFSLNFKFYLINNLVDTNFEHYCLYFFIFYTVYLKLSYLHYFLE